MFSLTELEDFDFRIAEEKDVNHIVDILHAAARVDASQEERSSQGFVQGRMGKEGIEQWILADSPVRGAVVAHNKMDDSIIGVCFFSPVPTEIAGPPVVQGIAKLLLKVPMLMRLRHWLTVRWLFAMSLADAA